MGTFLYFIRTYLFSKSLFNERTLSEELKVSFYNVYCPDCPSGDLNIIFKSYWALVNFKLPYCPENLFRFVDFLNFVGSNKASMSGLLFKHLNSSKIWNNLHTVSVTVENPAEC